jgi:hypothetical protein
VVADDETGGLFLDRPRRREAATSHARGFRLIELLSGCHPGRIRGKRAVKLILVFFGILGASAAHAQNAPWCLETSWDGSLHCTYATFQQPGRSYGEWILHSKLNLPALLAIHSAALARKVIFPNPPPPRASPLAHSDF